jgi:hypothetical protein
MTCIYVRYTAISVHVQAVVFVLYRSARFSAHFTLAANEHLVRAYLCIDVTLLFARVLHVQVARSPRHSNCGCHAQQRHHSDALSRDHVAATWTSPSRSRRKSLQKCASSLERQQNCSFAFALGIRVAGVARGRTNGWICTHACSMSPH